MMPAVVLIVASAFGSIAVADVIDDEERRAEQLQQDGRTRDAGLVWRGLLDRHPDHPARALWFVELALVAARLSPEGVPGHLEQASREGVDPAQLAPLETAVRAFVAQRLEDTSHGCSAFVNHDGISRLLAVYVTLFPRSRWAAAAESAHAQRLLWLNPGDVDAARALFQSAAARLEGPGVEFARACAADVGRPACAGRVGAGWLAAEPLPAQPSSTR